MKVGVPREIKPDEHRVALTPTGIRELVDRGHEVLVERGAGLGSGIADESYVGQGARLVVEAEDLYRNADLVVKVKEPQLHEAAWLGPRQVLFAYLHLAAERELTDALMESGVTAIAYETVTDAAGRLPLLAPMSEVAGRLAAQAGAWALEKGAGGRGALLGGVAGVPPATVMVIGAGVAGQNAAEVTVGLGAETYVYDRSLDRLREVELRLGRRCRTCFASTLELEARLSDADLVIGAVLVRGARAPRVLAREHLRDMRAGSVLVDISIDQGGCFETSRPTTHSSPTYEVEGIVHYCVTNMPGAVPVTSTRALTNATLPYVLGIAEAGASAALRSDAGLLAGLNVAAGSVVCAEVATAHDLVVLGTDAALAAIEEPMLA